MFSSKVLKRKVALTLRKKLIFAKSFGNRELVTYGSLYILAGITPPKIRRLIAAQKERYIQPGDGRHMLHCYLECKEDSNEGTSSMLRSDWNHAQ